MRISLNLATRPFTDLGPAIKQLRIAMAVLAVLAIGLGLGLRAFHQKAEEARAHDHSLDAKIAAIAQERKSYEELMRQPANAELLAHVTVLNQIFDEKAFSWTLAMEDLETVLPGGVQVTTLEPNRDTKTGKITLKLRVVGPRDRALELVRNLEHSRHFLLPRIVGESAEASGGPNERLEPVSATNRFNFDLLADYNSAAPPDPKHKEARAKEETQAKTQTNMPPNHQLLMPPAPHGGGVPLAGQSRFPYAGQQQHMNPQQLPYHGPPGPIQPNFQPPVHPNPTPGGPK
jgi:type IV pilus assembly protein PilN